MSANVCPSCNRPLAAAVINGPTQAVVRCEGCQTLLLWSNGRVMRSAKSTTGTMMGMPAVQVPAAGVTRPAVPPREREAPLPELRPEADATAALPKTPAPRSAPPKTPPPRSGTQPLMGRVPTAKQSVTGLGDNIPTKVAEPSAELRKESARKDPTPSPMKVPPSGPMKVSPNAPATVRKDPTPPPMKVPPSGPLKVPPSAPMKVSPSGPNKIGAPPPAAKAEPPSADAAKGEAPHVVAAVAQVPKMSDGGELVDPSAWFAGDVSEVVAPESVPPLPAPPAPPVIESTRPARADTTGAQPLPPPPSLSAVESAPFEIEAPGNEPTPALGTLMPEARAQDSAPIAVGRDPSQKIPLREPSPRVETGKKPASSIRGADPLVPPPSSTAAEPTDLPRARTTIGKPPEAPLRSTMLGRPAAELPRAPEAPAARPTPAATATPAAPRTPPRGEPVAAAVSMLPPPAAAAPRPSDATPVKGHAAFNAPAATVEREVSAEAPPPPPTASPADTTAQTTLPAQPETRRVPLQVSRRLLFIVGGVTAGVIVLVFMVVAMSRGPKRPAPSPSPIAITKPAPTPPAPTPPAPTPPAPAPSPPVAAAPKPATPPPTEVAPPPAPPPTEEPVAPPPPPPRPRHTLGGKKVVLEYDPKPTSPTPPAPQAVTPMGEDPATVARARETYHRGNVKLFAGDSAGAIALYRESLKIYPGYVAGYRGLGLGYEAAGDLGEALKAFHTYVRTVPSANDTPIIRRRIDRLESQKSGGAPH